MSIQDSDLMLFDGYLAGDLNEQEIEVLERRMKDDASFAASFKVYKDSVVSVKQKAFVDEVAALMQEKKADSIEPEAIEGKSHSMGNRGFSIYRYAAAASILIAVSYFSWTTFGVKSNEDVYLSYYAPYDGIVTTRDDSGSYLEGLSAYSNGGYEEALNMLLNAQADHISQAQMSLLIGNCYMNLGDVDNAVITLGKIADDNDQMTLSNRDWYLALCYLKLEQITEAKTLLTNLVESNTAFSRNARVLLEESIFE